MRLACRLALALLGGWMAWSAGVHWLGSDELRRHYAESVLGARGLPLVAAAQSVAAVGLLWPRSQAIAAFILAGVMLVAAATHLRAGSIDPRIWQPVTIAAWAAVPAALLLRDARRRS